MRQLCLLVLPVAFMALGGCALWPDRIVEPTFHNPFPQLYRVAVLPCYNQSAEPTVDGEAVAIAYYNELQTIPGFEVMPVGVARQMLAASTFASGQEPRSGPDFQRLARQMGVDAVLVGSVTEFSPYYPPRLGLTVDWYAANPSFHPIPPGYGLPWGRAEEEFIPSTLVQAAEFALAREQLQTQTPEVPPAALVDGNVKPAAANSTEAATAASSKDKAQTARASAASTSAASSSAAATGKQIEDALPLPVAAGPERPTKLAAAPPLPADWPDPRGFIPPPPRPSPPTPNPQYAPIMTHTQIYHSQDSRFTERLATYYYLRDDARFGGWPAYLERPGDFIRFCCYLHVTETLAARGGTGEARVLWRWPIRRYER